jgi:chemotaxis protein methyltransferase CheR
VTIAREFIEADEAEFRALIEKITRERGFQCASYKDKCLRRRIAVRIRARGASGCAEYAAILDSDQSEYERLMRSLTVNVTKFFRNWETYSAVSQKVIPALMDGRERDLRVWSAGCATGEEPYSIAILMHRHAAASKTPGRLGAVSIVGTDIDRTCLEHAERGLYQESALGDTPPDIREEYFRDASGFVTVLPETRKPVTFQYADLLRFRAPFESADLIVCRNVVIYFERAAQDALFAHFYETLAPGGFLVLGKVETLLGATRQVFAPVNARERIFRKI